MIVFISNFINHHQFPVANELYQLTNGDYRFIETMKMPNSLAKAGYPDLSNYPWVIKAWESDEKLEKAKHLINESEAVIFGGAECIPLVRQRIKENKLTFSYAERWFKRGILNLLSKNLWKSMILYNTTARKKNLFHLCASAFGAQDLGKLGIPRNKCLKWGYFPVFKDKDKNLFLKESNKTVKIITVCRFIRLKRLDLVIKMAYELKKAGHKFSLDMYGDGPLRKEIQQLIEKLNLGDLVKLQGNHPNEEIHKAMQEADIFIFTSTKREGWGAVINEALYNGCAVVSSDKIGSAPYLIKPGKTGLLFKSGKLKDLTKKVSYLIDNPEERIKMAIEGKKYISEVWSPKNAAYNLMDVISAFSSGMKNPIKSGPCSNC